MKKLDVILQQWRYRKIGPYIKPNACVLDVGCFDGSLFRYHQQLSITGIGVDRHIPHGVTPLQGVSLIEGTFPDSVPSDQTFDVITMLAVIEHIPYPLLREWATACHRFLSPTGVLVITAPSPRVDIVLDVLLKLKLVHGMSLEEHHGFAPEEIPALFAEHFSVREHRTFQLGLNHLFILDPGT